MYFKFFYYADLDRLLHPAGHLLSQCLNGWQVKAHAALLYFKISSIAQNYSGRMHEYMFSGLWIFWFNTERTALPSRGLRGSRDGTFDSGREYYYSI